MVLPLPFLAFHSSLLWHRTCQLIGMDQQFWCKHISHVIFQSMQQCTVFIIALYTYLRVRTLYKSII